jgi:hypothetical protein
MRAGLLAAISGKSSRVIDREAQFVAVLAGLALASRATRADPGIVDQEIEPIAALANLAGEAAHFGKRRQVGRQKNCRAAPGRRNLIGNKLAALAIASVNDNPGAPIGQPARDQAAYAIGRTRNECGLVVQIHIAVAGLAASKRIAYS